MGACGRLLFCTGQLEVFGNIHEPLPMAIICEKHLKNKRGLRLAALNVRGINTKEKQERIVFQLRRDLADIMILVDTKMKQEDASKSRVHEIQNAFFLF